MESGGIDVRQRTREIIRFAGLLIPMMLVVYGYIVDPTALSLSYSAFVFPMVMLPWVLLSIITFLFPAEEQRELVLRIIGYHVCAAAYILLISGFTTPFVTLGWALLLLVSYIYMADRGLALNIAVLLLVVIVSMLGHADDSELMLLDAVSVVFIFIIGSIILVLNRIQQDDSEELQKSRAEESLQRNRINTLINNLADAVISINDDGVVEVYNAASLNLLDTNVSLDGRPIDDIMKVRGKSGKTVSLLSIAKKARGLKVRDDLTIDIGDETIRLEVTFSPVRSSYSRSKGPNSGDGYVLILRDITKSKSLEEERDEFISVVSHELRTPITVVEGTLSNVQLMVERGKVPPGTLERSLNEAHDQVLFLSRMVNDLSTLSRAERGVADTPERIDVKKMLDSLYNEYAPEAAKKHLHFDLDTAGKLGTVTASHLYLRELLQNFITNAIKYTKEGSVTLRTERHGHNIRFEIKDTGIGISKGDQSKIFDKFYRSEDYRTRETGGTGLGLYVAAKLARKLNTRIEVKSRLNHGSSFSFSLQADDSKFPSK